MRRFAICLLVVVLVAMVSVGQAQAEQIIGKTDLLSLTPFYQTGDGNSPDSLWLHKGLVMPGDGILTKVTVRNDDDHPPPPGNGQGDPANEVSEEFTLLVLRPTGTTDEFTVIHRVQLFDDNPTTITGEQDYALNNLSVQTGDTLAHWWDQQNGGAIPFSNDLPNNPVGDSLTYFDNAVITGALDEGDTYAFSEENVQIGVSVRDMYLNATFVVPEPSTCLLASLGLLGLLFGPRRRHAR